MLQHPYLCKYTWATTCGVVTGTMRELSGIFQLVCFNTCDTVFAVHVCLDNWRMGRNAKALFASRLEIVTTGGSHWKCQYKVFLCH